MSTPKAHQSTARPYFLSRRIYRVENQLIVVDYKAVVIWHTSGAMNSGVPQNVLVVEPYHMSSLHRP
jgi:hypothetical protein